jgi:NADH-quinone oxidoreductase subunit M
MWEVTMIPMYFMIIFWGGPGRITAGLKFILYSLIGSLLLLVGILYGGFMALAQRKTSRS